MRIQFDSEQQYQLDAIRAVVDLFEGQQGADAFGSFDVDGGGGLELTEQGFGNALALSPEAVRKNLMEVQKWNGLDRYGPPDARMRFAVEMETGTGKTYVYLRTIFELHRRYGWSKFVIVVPSVAIREGVLSSLSIMREHFRGLYDAVPYDHWVYDSGQASRLRNFATGSTLQILVLNIQAFDKKDVAVIYQERDATNGIAPIEYVRSAQPVVILDEPQNMGSKNARAAIEGLNPLFELHYSATHREMINPVYRLTPVEAYDLGLVKQIEVSSVLQAEDFNRPYLKLVAMTGRPKFSATVEMDVETKGVQKRKAVKITKPGQDLFDLSGGLEKYRNYEVDSFDPEEGWLMFINGERLELGKTEGANHDAVMRAQVRETVERHFKREAEMRRLPEAERMKVLSLFFVDRVANYAPEDGIVRKWFEEAYREAAAARPDLPMPPVESVHYGYFAQDKNGAKDSRGVGTTEADREAYELIMRDKERLLSRDEPLAFLFTHSALREGWDNPNVFQICTLREVGSETQRRQQIGRGLRLPVQADGVRSRDKNRNVLTVVASESFESFAKALQEEIKTDCGVEFKGRIVDAKAKERVRLRDGWDQLDGFAEIWAKIRPRTRYNVQFSTEELIERAAAELAKLAPVRKPTVRVHRTGMSIGEPGVSGRLLGAHGVKTEAEDYAVPNLLAYLQARTELTRQTLAEILIRSEKLDEVKINPQQFLDNALACINGVLHDFLIDGIQYEQIEGEAYEQTIFEEEQIEVAVSSLVPVENSIYEKIPTQSGVERTFASDLDGVEAVPLFFKLPSRFKIETPIGTYNPDWAIVLDRDQRLKLVRETKGTLDPTQRRQGENDKIACGARHFEALEVDFETAKTAIEVLESR